MRKSQIDRPLGKILHIVDGEAITHPHTAFSAKNAKVVLDTLEEIGILGDPFGSTDRPFQPIILKNPDQNDIIGKLAYAQIKNAGKPDRKNRGKRTSRQQRPKRS